MNYIVTVDGKQQLKDISKMCEHIRKVNEQVETATDKYKSCMEELYLLKRFKANGKAPFNQFIKEKTGMSSSMAYRLVQIWKRKIELMREVDEKDSEKFSKLFDSLSMRRYLIDLTYGTLGLLVDRIGDYNTWEEANEALKIIEQEMESSSNLQSIERKKDTISEQENLSSEQENPSSEPKNPSSEPENRGSMNCVVNVTECSWDDFLDLVKEEFEKARKVGKDSVTIKFIL